MRPWEPPVEQVIQPPKPKRWPMVVLLLALLGVAVAGLWMIRDRQLAALRSEVLPRVTEVRSELSATAESLQIVPGPCARHGSCDVRRKLPTARSESATIATTTRTAIRRGCTG